MATNSLERRVQELEGTNRGLLHEVERLQADNEIRNLLSKHEYLHTANKQKELMDLYSQKAPDASVCIQNVGTWKGKDAGKRAWSHLDLLPKELLIGMMAIHPVTTPIIEVAGDGKTAKTLFVANGLVAKRDPETGVGRCFWEWDKCGVDFIKEDGKWKIWHFHIYRIFKAGWDEKWADLFDKIDTLQEVPPIPDELQPDGPATDDCPYRPDAEYKGIPALPEPYETFDLKIAY